MSDKDTRSRNKVGRAGVADRVVRSRAKPLTGPHIDALLVDALAGREHPLSAYDLAAELRLRGQRTAVMSVYRALDRLVSRRLVQKVETLAAYRLRDEPAAILLICIGCGRTASIAAAAEHKALVRLVSSHDFDPSDIAVETRGRCGNCRESVSDRPLP